MTEQTTSLTSLLIVGIPLLLIAVALMVFFFGIRTEFRNINVSLLALAGKQEPMARNVEDVKSITSRTDNNVQVIRERTARFSGPNE